jgi:hypothetical protein
MLKKLTTEDFIIKAKDVHGDKYNYSMVEYVTAKIKVSILCSEHGEFEQVPNNHLSGQGCPICGGKTKLTIEEFIRKAKEVHGDKYDYSLVKYKNAITKVKIKCNTHNHVFEQMPYSHLRGDKLSIKSAINKNGYFIKRAKEKHGNKYDYSKVNYVDNKTKVKIKCNTHNQIFKQTPAGHLSGKGCPVCSDIPKLTTEEFVIKAQEVHSDKYDYSLVEYKNINTKVKIIDDYGFMHEQRPVSHLSGSGLSLKSVIDKNGYFARRAQDVHGNKYDYSLVEYKDTDSKIRIKCNIHNYVFEQSPNNHLRGSGCPKCYGRSK